MGIINKCIAYSIICILSTTTVGVKVAYAAEAGANQGSNSIILAMGVGLTLCFLLAAFFFFQYRKKTREVEGIFYFDPVSQLPNREYIAEYVNKMPDKGTGYVFAMISMDEFEEMNSLFGHETREFMYQYFAKYLSETMGEEEILCSISNNTYGMLFKMGTRQGIIDRFGEILKKIEDTSVRDETSNYSYLCKFYGGLYEITGEEDDFDEIFNRCSLAQTKANHQGKLKYEIFDSSMQNELKQKKQLMVDIEEAFNKNEIKPYFQPQYDSEDKTVCGAELIARWEHPTVGLIRATEFISLLEVNGKILDLDLYIFEEACKQIKKWVESERMPVPIWVNVFQHNLYETKFIEKVMELTQKYSVPERLLGFEIRSNLLAVENMEILETIQRYHERGFLVCVDRFEPSSPMSILYSYPLDRVKITNEFLELAKRSERVKNGLKNLILFSKEQNISTCGKGVQTQEDEELLIEVECEALQGDFYGDACDMKRFEEIIF